MSATTKAMGSQQRLQTGFSETASVRLSAPRDCSGHPACALPRSRCVDDAGIDVVDDEPAARGA